MKEQRKALLTPEGPAEEDVRIIAVELAIQCNGQGEVELEMFPTKHTIPGGALPWSHNRVRITLHTSHGDFTIIAQHFRPNAQVVAV